MSALQFLGDDGKWHDFPGFYRAAFGPPETTDNGDGTYTHVWSIDDPYIDDAVVSLADDDTWRHLRNLCPAPEHFEGT